MTQPLCFVLMPFGVKPARSGASIDFNDVYDRLIRPSILDAGLEPLRADEELDGGVIHKAMFERLVLCEFAVADLTTANPNVFYELGLRHGIRPASTVLLYAPAGGPLPFDVAMLRAIPYALDPHGRLADPAAVSGVLAERLRAARRPSVDSPVYQLLNGMSAPDLARLKTDVFRDRVRYSEDFKRRLREARRTNVEAVRGIERQMGDLATAESAEVVDLYLSYRSLEAWEDMIRLYDAMSDPLRATTLVREQLGLALNRAGRGEEAEDLLLDLVAERGPSSETYGILGRVYKDRFEAARDRQDDALARGALGRAIDAYLKGFEADWRDAYPGVNALTLMEIREPPDPRRVAILPVVRYSNQRRLAGPRPDVWDHATNLELAVLARDEAAAREALAALLAIPAESWQPRSTAKNLKSIRLARERGGDAPGWAQDIERTLLERADAAPRPGAREGE